MTTNPSIARVAEIARGLTKAQRRIVAEALAESETDYPFQSFKHTAEGCGLSVEEVKAAMPDLRRGGVMVFRSGLWSEEGPYGSGYALSDLGLAVRHHLSETQNG